MKTSNKGKHACFIQQYSMLVIASDEVLTSLGSNCFNTPFVRTCSFMTEFPLTSDFTNNFHV